MKFKNIKPAYGVRHLRPKNLSIAREYALEQLESLKVNRIKPLSFGSQSSERIYFAVCQTPSNGHKPA